MNSSSSSFKAGGKSGGRERTYSDNDGKLPKVNDTSPNKKS